MDDLINTQLGRYRLLEKIGEGGMGAVYLALDTRLDCDVAVKVLLPGRKSGEIFLKRFEREAKRMAKLTHPNLVKVTDYGDEDGKYYLVMPNISGGTLSDLPRPMAAEHAAKYLIPVARALGYAHSQGTIHRDVKPSNILLTESGEPMLTDFGIARLVDDQDGTTITKTGLGVGTPAYMAPEQIKKGYDHKVDIYALGVVLYELVTGQQPFKGDTPLDTLFKHATEPLPPPRQVNPNVSRAAEAVIVRALAKQPDQRFQTMDDFAQVLQGIRQEEDELSLAGGQKQRGEEADLNETMDELAPSVVIRQHAPAKRQSAKANRWLLFGGLGAVILIGVAVVVGAVVLISNLLRSEPTPVAVSETQPVAAPSAGMPDLPTQPVAAIRTSTIASPEEPALVYTATIWPTLTATATKIPGPGAVVPMEDEIQMVYVPEGTFTMGSNDGYDDEQPVHEVYLDGYWIDKYEVTNAQYKECVTDGVCDKPDETDYYDDPFYANHPVVYVSWFDAQAYCEWAGRRLPTEAEWEKAARGTDGRLYPWGNDSPNASLLNYDQNEGGTTAVGSFPAGASPYDAMDMAGNVWEWTADWYDDNYYSVSLEENPTGPSSGEYRVLRGGSWLDVVRYVRSAYRDWYSPGSANNYGGFRCASSP